MNPIENHKMSGQIFLTHMSHIYLTIYIIRVTLNTQLNTLQPSFFHAHATAWIIMNVVLLESWFAKVRCIHLLRSLGWISQQQT